MDSLVGTVVADRFQVLRLLGRGGMGKVYEVELTQLKKRFAMKVLARELAGKKDALRRFRREAEIVASLNHPNIIEIVDWGTADDGRPIYVMELLEGMDLEERIKATGPLPWSEIATIAAQSISALLEAHGKGILHRDLKPTNIFLTEGGPTLRVKLIDFGLAKARDLAAITMYTCPKLIGTPAYMSPQQLQGESAVGEEADCWAMAALLYEAATGERAFKGGYAALIYSIGKESPTPIGELRPDTPPAFADAIAAALSPDKSRRITSLEELGDRLANSLVGQGGGAVKASLKSLARATTRDEDKKPGTADTLPWGATVEDAEPAGRGAGQGKGTSPELGTPDKKEVPIAETLPWGTEGISPKPGKHDSDPVDQGIAKRQRSSQRLTKAERPAQPSESISSAPVAPKATGHGKSQDDGILKTTEWGGSGDGASQRQAPVESQGSAEHYTKPSGPWPSIEASRSTEIPRRGPTRARIYALWIVLLAGIVALVLVLQMQSDNSQQPASEALPPTVPAPAARMVMMDASTNDRTGQAPPIATKAADAGSSPTATPEDTDPPEGTLNMDAEPGAATLQVFANPSKELVFEGTTPRSLRLPVGQYRVLTEHKGYLSNMTIVEIKAERAVDNKVVLIARPKKKSRTTPTTSRPKPTTGKPTPKRARDGDNNIAPNF